MGAALPPRPALLSCAVSAGGGGERGAGALPAEEAAGRRRGGALRQPPAARGSGSRRGGRAAAAGAGGGRGLVPELPGAAGRAEEAGGPAGCRRLPAQRRAGKCSAPHRTGGTRGGGRWREPDGRAQVRPQKDLGGEGDGNAGDFQPRSVLQKFKDFPSRAFIWTLTRCYRVKNKIGSLGRGAAVRVPSGTRPRGRPRARVPGTLPVSLRGSRGRPALLTPPRGCRSALGVGFAFILPKKSCRWQTFSSSFRGAHEVQLGIKHSCLWRWRKLWVG